jgi:signal transduction histidine kinase
LRPNRLIKSESFRLAAAFTGLFLTLAGILTVAVLWIVDRTQLAALRRANHADIATVQNGYRDEGVDEAVEVVKQMVGPTLPADANRPVAYILLEKDGTGKLAGNLSMFSPRSGEWSLPMPEWNRGSGTDADEHPGARDRGAILGYGAYIAPGVYVFVGRSTHQILETRNAILDAFLWISGGSVILACLGGIWLGARFLSRVDAITRTCEAIVAGRFNERIPARESGNEWDGLARAINEMLNRISTLLENLRQVSSDVAHDLRTPLTRLRARLEEARLKSDTIQEFNTAVAHAIDDTDQLLALFSALLRISQIDSGSRLNALSRLSLSDLMNRVYQMYLPVAEDHQHPLLAEIERDVMVLGDQELLTQMFSNLVENAIRHTPAGTRIRIALAGNGTPLALISDDGPGIPECERGKVLQRFYQLSHSRNTGGHGLGLALVAAIAGLHKAALSLEEAGPGLCVRVTFPR